MINQILADKRLGAGKGKPNLQEGEIIVLSNVDAPLVGKKEATAFFRDAKSNQCRND